MTVHNTDPLGNDGPISPAPAQEVGLQCASGNDNSVVVRPRLRLDDAPEICQECRDDDCLDCKYDACECSHV